MTLEILLFAGRPREASVAADADDLDVRAHVAPPSVKLIEAPEELPHFERQNRCWLVEGFQDEPNVASSIPDAARPREGLRYSRHELAVSHFACTGSSDPVFVFIVSTSGRQKRQARPILNPGSPCNSAAR